MEPIQFRPKKGDGMNKNPRNLRIEECRRALESCPHDQGTVRSVFRLCLGRQSLHAWDTAKPMFVEIDCPGCSGEPLTAAWRCVHALRTSARRRLRESSET